MSCGLRVAGYVFYIQNAQPKTYNPKPETMTHWRGTMTTWMRAGIALACLALAPRATAQPTNLEAYQTLALRCLAETPDTTQAFRLDAPAQMPYLRTTLAHRWREEGRALFLADSLQHASGPALPRLKYEIEEARVDYARARRKQLARTITLALRYTFTDAEGRLLREDRCLDAFTDTIRRRDREALEWEAFPETQGEAPPRGWLHRYLEPAVLAVATAVTVYLFFNIRSERTDDGV